VFAGQVKVACLSYVYQLKRAEFRVYIPMMETEFRNLRSHLFIVVSSVLLVWYLPRDDVKRERVKGLRAGGMRELPYERYMPHG
jgi:hypothetical protein